MKLGAVLLLSGCSLYFGTESGEQDDHAVDAATAMPVDIVTSLRARCAAAEGPAVVLDPSKVSARLAGMWWFCAGAAEFYGPVEFTLDQHYYMLTETNGTFVRNLGPTMSGTYSIEPTSPGILFAIWQLPTLGGGPIYSLRGYIEENPTKLFLGGGFYVPIP